MKWNTTADVTVDFRSVVNSSTAMRWGLKVHYCRMVLNEKEVTKVL